MVKPIHFKKNEETAVNNYFQRSMEGISTDKAQDLALREFDTFVAKLRQNQIEVVVFEDTEISDTPDSIFPNNWVTLHDDGTIITYPMFAPNRRRERREDVINKFREEFFVDQIFSFTHWEEKNKFLEGTGSLILDRPHKVAYAALSERTSIDVLEDFHNKTGYEILSFHANQTVNNQRLPIYHTNVMMAVGEKFAVVALECIDNSSERDSLVNKLQSTGKEIIGISEEQIHQFAGNILQVKNKDGDSFIVMSSAAFHAFNDDQLERLKIFGEILDSPIPTIETLGGGGVRCMMAEVFLPKPTLVTT